MNRSEHLNDWEEGERCRTYHSSDISWLVLLAIEDGDMLVGLLNGREL
jgi:hypothetical protein